MTASLNEAAQELTEFTLQYSGVTQKQNNTSYPFTAVIHCVDDLKKVAAFDNIGAKHSDGENNRSKLIKGYRSLKTFEWSNCLPVEVYNEQKKTFETGYPPGTVDDCSCLSRRSILCGVFTSSHDGKERKSRSSPFSCVFNHEQGHRR